MARRICRVLIFVYLLMYLATLATAFIGARGVFGFQPEAFSGIYLVLLGMPWTLVLAFLEGDGFPVFLARIFVAAAPLLNVWIAYLLCRSGRRRYGA